MNKNEEILQAIISYIQKHGYSPTTREIGDAVGLSSPSSVHLHLKQMLERGMLETDAGFSSPRAIRVPGYKFTKEEQVWLKGGEGVGRDEKRNTEP